MSVGSKSEAIFISGPAGETFPRPTFKGLSQRVGTNGRVLFFFSSECTNFARNLGCITNIVTVGVPEIWMGLLRKGFYSRPILYVKSFSSAPFLSTFFFHLVGVTRFINLRQLGRRKMNPPAQLTFFAGEILKKFDISGHVLRYILYTLLFRFPCLSHIKHFFEIE